MMNVRGVRFAAFCAPESKVPYGLGSVFSFEARIPDAGPQSMPSVFALIQSTTLKLVYTRTW
jgi:hypothetical protein